MIRAKVVLVRSGKVHLKRNDQVFQFPFAKLSETDQKYVREWAKANVKYWFSFQEKKIDDTAERETEGSGRNKTVRSVSHYSLEVANRSGVPVKDVSLKYSIAVRRKWGEESGYRQVYYLNGEESIPQLDDTKRITLNLMDVKLMDAKWQKTKLVRVTNSDGRTYTEKRIDDYRMEFFLDGIWVKLFHGENEIAEYRSKEKSIRDAIWGESEYGYDPEGSLKRQSGN